MSRIRADKLVNKNASGGPDFPLGATVTGIMTAAGGFAGDGSNLTGVPASSLIGSPNITVGTVGAGNVTSSGTVSAVTGTFSGNVSIGGTLTYDDVTNIDSVGLITARKGINVTAGVSTFAAATHQNAGTKLTGPYSANITAMGANDVDCSAGNYFTKTITGATTFTFSNAPSGVVYSFTMEVTLNGSNAITWPAAVKWNADTAPTITDGKTQLFMFITDDGGTRWRGSSLVDYVN
tara:strand:+ start:618 stop:1325 length:708 start_codon:yes stop_codon:yes gene_type:complete